MSFSFRGKTFYLHSQSESAEEYSFGPDQSRGVRVYDYTGTDAKLPQYILGWPDRQTGVDGTVYIARYVPHSVTFYRRISDGYTYLFAQRCGVKYLHPTGTQTSPDTSELNPAQDETGQYETTRLTVEYQTLPFDVLSDDEMTAFGNTTGTDDVPDESTLTRYVSKIIKPQGEFFSIPGNNTVAGSYYYVGTNTVITQGVGKLIVPYQLAMTWHQIPEDAIPCGLLNSQYSGRKAIETTVGKVNKTAFNGYAIGTLLLMGAEIKPYRSPFGERIFDITYLFKYFEPVSAKGHNYIYRWNASPATWTEISTDTNNPARTASTFSYADGYSLYDWAEFADLFRPI